MAPATKPTTRAVSRVSHIWPGLAFATVADAMADMAITLPTDRSIPPVRMTRVWPRAMSANGAAAMRMDWTLSMLANRALR